MRDEHETLSVVDASLPLNDPGFRTARRAQAAFLFSPLCNVPAVMLRFGRLDIKCGGFRQIVKETEHVLVLFGRQVLGDRRAPGGDQEEDAPEPRALLLYQARDLPQPPEVVPCHRSVHLCWQADLAGMLQREHRPCEGALHAPESIMACGVRS